MTAKQLTDKQRQAIDCLEGARKEGVALSAYARSRGLAVRQIYDAMVALRRRGVLPAAGPRSKNSFVAVRVAASSVQASSGAAGEERSALLCRVLIGGGEVIECREWPAAQWLAALLAERNGAAT
jgi:hypothetical protein